MCVWLTLIVRPLDAHDLVVYLVNLYLRILNVSLDVYVFVLIKKISMDFKCQSNSSVILGFMSDMAIVILVLVVIDIHSP